MRKATDIWDRVVDAEYSICGEYCRHSNDENITQEELDRICEECPFSRLNEWLKENIEGLRVMK